MSKLESRPTGSPWTYRFFVEFEHAANDAALPRTLDAMRSAASSFSVLGTFARAVGAARQPREATDVVA
jgi:prephenate dehydratase